MPDQHLFEYNVLRIVPRVEREEFINTGIVLYCARQKFLQVKYQIDIPRLAAFAPGLDINEVARYLCAFEQICQGVKTSSPIASLPIAERFRWLTATRSTIIQTSKVHPGLCSDAGIILERLYEQIIL